MARVVLMQGRREEFVLFEESRVAFVQSTIFLEKLRYCREKVNIRTD